MNKKIIINVLLLNAIVSVSYAGMKMDKKKVCHYTDNNELIVLSLPAKAASKHMEHGDSYPSTYYEDLDSDGYGNPDVSTVSCELPTGFTDNNSDLNDSDDSIGDTQGPIINYANEANFRASKFYFSNAAYSSSTYGFKTYEEASMFGSFVIGHQMTFGLPSNPYVYSLCNTTGSQTFVEGTKIECEKTSDGNNIINYSMSGEQGKITLLMGWVPSDFEIVGNDIIEEENKALLNLESQSLLNSSYIGNTYYNSSLVKDYLKIGSYYNLDIGYMNTVSPINLSYEFSVNVTFENGVVEMVYTNARTGVVSTFVYILQSYSQFMLVNFYEN